MLISILIAKKPKGINRYQVDFKSNELLRKTEVYIVIDWKIKV